MERLPGERKPKEIGAEELQMMERLRPYARQSGDGIRPPWFMKGRKLLDYLLVGIGSGNGVFTVGEDSFAVERGDLVWIPPMTVHEMRGTSQAMRCSYVHFDLVHDAGKRHWDACIPGGTLDLSKHAELAQSGHTGTVCDKWSGKLKLSNAPEALAMIRAIAAEREREQQGFNLAASGMLLQLMALILRGLSDDGGKAKALTRKASEAIAEGSGACGMKVSQMAKSSSLSQAQFRRLYRKANGESPRKAMLKARMRKACELLVYSGMNVSEVAAKLGYSNMHNFSRAFAKELGVTPSEYGRS